MVQLMYPPTPENAQEFIEGVQNATREFERSKMDNKGFLGFGREPFDDTKLTREFLIEKINEAFNLLKNGI